MNHDNITQGRPENTHLGSSGPLEAPRGQTSHTIQNFKKCHFSKKFEILNFQNFKFQKNVRYFWRVCDSASSAAGAKHGSQVLQHGSQQEARGPSAARVTSAHPQGCTYMCSITRRGKATVKCMCVYVCVCVCVCMCMYQSMYIRILYG